ncbi:MAG: hypothetical protein CMK09_09010 [Ponticaulis sp.]|nr:hypothetical protein [Ponticaulis sp.]|tara:strand:- start:31170 stop:32354 length:1185 start_codon:yes stop_codon:yes gene_type:complete
MPRNTVLLTWELGEGLGHIRPLKLLGYKLADAGFDLVFACRDPVLAGKELHSSLGRVIAAPFQPRPRTGLGQIRNYASLLQIQGYAEENELLPLVRAWKALIDLVDPALIIADHSPSAILAARGSVPVVQVGNGFLTPPPNSRRFPDLQWTDADVLAPAADGKILQTVNRVLSHFEGESLTTLPEMMNTAGQCVFCLPELDPYRPLRQTPVLGPLEPVPRLMLYPADLRVFAYLSSDYAAFDTVTKILSHANFDRNVFVRGLSDAHAHLLENSGLPLSQTAPPLTETLPAASLVIHHGGIATTQACLFAGRPQIILPQHNEARHTAAIMQEMGVAVSLERKDAHKLPEVFARYQSDRDWREAAMAQARTFQNREMADPMKGFLTTALAAMKEAS